MSHDLTLAQITRRAIKSVILVLSQQHCQNHFVQIKVRKPTTTPKYALNKWHKIIGHNHVVTALTTQRFCMAIVAAFLKSPSSRQNCTKLVRMTLPLPSQCPSNVRNNVISGIAIESLRQGGRPRRCCIRSGCIDIEEAVQGPSF